MAMTVKLGENFYTPFGIYKSPIAKAACPQEGKYKNLSLSFHAYVAHIVGTINPVTKYLIVRPLSSMLAIFKKSGLKHSASAYSNNQPKNLIYVFFAVIVVWSPPRNRTGDFWRGSL
jgi:hypothetical protein